MLKICEKCGTQFNGETRNRFCSQQCAGTAKGQNLIDLVCQYCDKVYQQPQRRQGKSRFCSYECMGKGIGKEKKERNALNPYIKICPYCNKEFATTNKKRITCSQECVNVSMNRNPDGTSVVIHGICSICSKPTSAYPNMRSKERFCSKKCSAIGNGNRLRGKRINAVTVPCAQCKNDFTTFASRLKHVENIFCSRACYLVWHSTDRQTKEAREQMAIALCGSPKKNPNKLEIKVVNWLHDHSLDFAYQVPLSVWAVDFQVGDTYIEVNGCYWHGCKSCFPESTDRQIAHSSRDTALQWYCFRKGIILITIWEHDIENDSFSALLPLIQQKNI